ncbi:PKD domain-containing protein [Halobaculum sp. MBLA0143]|uniref:PKD domain-containing protein n=1 Tax=Halobaculum sp. MBLA0143 TaxID=3079933 RepID=UPI0035254B5A
MSDDTRHDGLRTVLVTTLLVGAAVAGVGAGVSAPAAAASTGVPAPAAAGNTAASPTASIDVRPVTPFAGRRAVLIGNATGLTDAAYDWRVETPTRGTVRLDGRRPRFRFRAAGTYALQLTVTGDDRGTARETTTVELRRTTVRLRGTDGPPGDATLVLDGDGAVGSGVYAVTDGSVGVVLRNNTSYVATALQDRDRSTPLTPDPGPADGLADFAVLGRVAAGETVTLRLPTAAPTTVRVVDADGGPVTLRRANTPGDASLSLRHDPVGLPAGGFRGFETNATGVVTLSGRPPELTGNVTVTVVPLADRFARTGRRLRRRLAVDGPARTTFVLNDSAGTAETRLPQTAVVGEPVPLNVTVGDGRVVAADWWLHGPDAETRRRAGAQTTFVPRVAGRFRVTVRAETASGETRLARADLRVARRTTVAGRVVRPDGGALADAVVRLYRAGVGRSAAAVRNGTGVARGPSTAVVTRTDENGRFEAVLAAGREYRTVVVQTPVGDPPVDGVPDVAVLGRFTAGVDAPGGQLPAPRRLTVAVETADGDRLSAGLLGDADGETVAVAVGHAPDGAGTTLVGWLPGLGPGDGEDGDGDGGSGDDDTRPVVEVAGAATVVADARTGWLVPTARTNVTATAETARLTLRVTDTTAPVAGLDGPARATVGDSVDFDATESRDRFGIAGYAWDLDGDDAFETAGNATRTWTPEDDGRRTVRVRVRDPAGNRATASHTVVVREEAGDGSDDGSSGDGGDENDERGSDVADDSGDDTGPGGGDESDSDDSAGSDSDDSAGGDSDDAGRAGPDDTTPTPRTPPPTPVAARTTTPAGSVPLDGRATGTPRSRDTPTRPVGPDGGGRDVWRGPDGRTATATPAATATPRDPPEPAESSLFRPLPGVVSTATPAVTRTAPQTPAGTAPSGRTATAAGDPPRSVPPESQRAPRTASGERPDADAPARAQSPTETDANGSHPLAAVALLVVAVAALLAVHLLRSTGREST